MTVWCFTKLALLWRSRIGCLKIMSIKLSKRLQVIADMVRHARVVDVGCDHAYLPIYLVQSGRVSGALATDIAAEPLARGHENAVLHGVGVGFMQADGISGVPAGYETCVIAGMGGESVMRILSSEIGAARGFKQLLLSPQRDVADVRRFLHTYGFLIVDEALVEENGKFYFVLDTVADSGAHCTPLREADYAFGRHLVERKCAVLARFLEAEILKYEKINRTEYSEYLLMCKEVLACIK